MNFSALRMHPYLRLMRLDRPVGALLLLWPTLAALWLAADGLPPAELIAVFTVGVLTMRAAGCVMNDMADRHLDPHVARTRNRPLATGELGLGQAAGLLFGLCLIALALLAFLNAPARWLALAALGISLLYPFCKRWFHLPQLVLGAAFSWGILMAFAAVAGAIPANGWLLFAASLIWIIAYDTLYAMADREEDRKIGVKSSAILFGRADRLAVGLLQLGAAAGFAMLGIWRSFGLIYLAGLAAILGLFAYQQVLIRKREPAACLRAFNNNIWVGFSLFAAVALETAR